MSGWRSRTGLGETAQDIAAVCFCGIAIAVGVACVGAGVAPLEPAGQEFRGIDGVKCADSLSFVDPYRLKRHIRSLMPRLGQPMTPAERQSAMELDQTLICRSILQDPAVAVDWAWLLTAAPVAATDAASRAALLKASYDLGRLEIEAAYWRLIFAANSWSAFDPNERSLVVSDARTLARTPFGNEYIVTLALLGAHGGPSLTAVFRQVVAEEAPQWLERTFDPYVAGALKKKP